MFQTSFLRDREQIDCVRKYASGLSVGSTFLIFSKPLAFFMGCCRMKKWAHLLVFLPATFFLSHRGNTSSTQEDLLLVAAASECPRNKQRRTYVHNTSKAEEVHPHLHDRALLVTKTSAAGLSAQHNEQCTTLRYRTHVDQRQATTHHPDVACRNSRTDPGLDAGAPTGGRS